jgi:hypothetical protein
MREPLWRRLEALEEIRKRRNGAVPIRHIGFVDAYGRPAEVAVAKGPGGFICRRAIGEELDAFRARAGEECRASRGPAILVFLREPSDAALR